MLPYNSRILDGEVAQIGRDGVHEFGAHVRVPGQALTRLSLRPPQKRPQRIRSRTDFVVVRPAVVAFVVIVVPVRVSVETFAIEKLRQQFRDLQVVQI